MKKRALSLFLAFVMVIGLLPGMALAAESGDNITAFVTIFDKGEFVKDKNEAIMFQRPVMVTDTDSDGKYSLDEVLQAAHKTYYTEGAVGYETSDGNYGKAVTTLWGKAADASGFYRNDTITDAVDAEEVRDGDAITAFLYYDTDGYSDRYSFFDVKEKKVEVGEEFTLTLKRWGYDEYRTPKLNPIATALIGAYNMETGVYSTPTAFRGAKLIEGVYIPNIATGLDGTVKFSITEPGVYYVTAQYNSPSYSKYDDHNNPIPNYLVPPVCKVTVGDVSATDPTPAPTSEPAPEPTPEPTPEVLPDASITVPGDAKLFVGSKTGNHYVPFTEVVATKSVTNSNSTTYYFDLKDNGTYNYRVSGGEYVTYAGTFKKTAGYSMTVTGEQLRPDGKNKTTVDHEVTSNGGQNVGDIFLNINAKGYLTLAADETYQIVNLRNWQAIDGFSANYFIEPDFHYAVLNESGVEDNSVVTVDTSGVVTAKGEGTAIVLVTYDAMTVQDEFYGAIWPENTGVFVVSVGAGKSGITTSMTINKGLNKTGSKKSGDALDAEHDIIYFLGEKGAYTFTPDTGCTVSVANPVVDGKMTFNGFKPVSANDGSFTVPLTEGRNIVKVEKGGKAEYQVITAKKVSVTINEGKPVVPGEAVSVKFDTLYHPANKLAGIYNTGAGIRYPVGDKLVGGAPGGMGEYRFASTKESQTITNYTERKETSNMWGSNISYKLGELFTIPADFQGDTYTLTGGALTVLGFGDPYGSHRDITLEKGRNPQIGGAVQREAVLGRLPDIEIPVTELTELTVTPPTRTTYCLGDSFDPAGMVVTAKYGSNTTAVVTNYTFDTAVFTESGTKNVEVSYTQGGTTVTANVEVTITEAELKSIAVTTQPAKTAYTVNEEFDPAGMVVTATYSDETTAEVTQYTLSHGKLIHTDSAVTVTYNGKTATVPVTVTGLELSRIAVSTKPAKLEYTVGDAFDPTGIVVTATYNDGTTADVTTKVSYADTALNEASNYHYITVSYTENGVTKTVPFSVKVMGPTEIPEPTDTITVQFTLMGDSHHGDNGETHTLKHGGLETWIAQTGIEVPKGSTVLDVTAKALGLAGIPYENEGNYISSIRGLAELDNGPLSGWMYTLNGRHPNLGVEEQTVKNGDRIVFHYTDDYTREQGSESWGPAPGTGDKEENAPLKPPVTVDKNGEASVTITDKDMKDSVADVKTSGADAIVIAPEIRGDVDKVAVELPKTSVDAIGRQTDAALTVQTGIADLTLPNEALTELGKGSGKSVTITAETVKDGGVEITVAVDGKAVESLTGGIALSLPVEKATPGTVLVLVDKDGSETVIKKSLADGKTVSAVVDGSCTVKAIDNAKTFSDVKNDWTADGIAFASGHELFSGVGGDKFAPDLTMDRAMLATVLFRLEDAKVSGENLFTDVAEGAWYAEGVTWANEVGIVTGTGNGFMPTAAITREQMATMLYRYAKLLGLDTKADGKLDAFSDSAAVSGWAKETMAWAVGAGLINGDGVHLTPGASATRAQVATILMRFQMSVMSK